MQEQDVLERVQDEADLQQRVMAEAELVLQTHEREAEEKRLTKLDTSITSQRKKLGNATQLLRHGSGSTSARIQGLEEELNSLLLQRQQVLERMVALGGHSSLGNLGNTGNPNEPGASDEGGGGVAAPQETRRERLIRQGKITPFSHMHHPEQAFASEKVSSSPSISSLESMFEEDDEEADETSEDHQLRRVVSSSKKIRDTDYIDASGDQHDEQQDENEVEDDEIADRFMDDGDERHYLQRYEKWCLARRRRRGIANEEDLHANIDQEMFSPCGVARGKNFGSGFQLSGDIYSKLFGYQKTCVKWLWELHCQEVGGIVGDEMGLGKTIQVISFLAGLSHSRKLKGPILILCPATVLRQWTQEFHKWWPAFRVMIAHPSGSGFFSSAAASSSSSWLGLEDEEEEGDSFSDESEEDSGRSSASFRSPKKRSRKQGSSAKSKKGKERAVENNSSRKEPSEYIMRLIKTVQESGHVLLTTYEAIRNSPSAFLPVKWSYVILDEGHKIRNPDSAVTLACKQLRTPHRIILSGTPIQNNLVELWSLYDFVYPGRLGTLPIFQAQFVIPIKIGGYSNASNIQVQTAYKCACILRDLINPYLLRRMKVDVASDLPKKTEQVLFCRLTDSQRKAYEQFLSSEDVSSILIGKRNALYGIDILRKICNHPDLVTLPPPQQIALDQPSDSAEDSPPSSWGDPKKSGKMVVVKSLLAMWKSQGHKALLFCQTRQTQDILVKMVRAMGLSYLRMDGTTPIKQRPYLIDEFNNSPEMFLFVLTTKVGGLGINLVGANRIILFDPDWNPASDLQARERAWRVGQKREVVIFRMMTSGTIEEKIYHRQIFKLFLTNKILKDPRQRRFFKSNDLHDLFTLGNQNEDGTETADLFHGVGAEISISRQGGDESSHAPQANLLGINGVDKVGAYNNNVVIDRATDGKDSAGVVPNADESRIMNALFTRTGVHSAHDHDKIMNASSHEAIIVEKEASRVAQEAIAALRESRKLIKQQRSSIAEPTFTGRFGSSGLATGRRPFVMNKPRFPTLSSTASVSLGALSSSAILSNLQHMASLDGTVKSTAPINRGAVVPDEDLSILTGICDYLRSLPDHSAPSADVIGQFKVKISPDKVPVFKSMLKGIAEFDRPRGVWILKREFIDVDQEQ